MMKPHMFLLVTAVFSTACQQKVEAPAKLGTGKSCTTASSGGSSSSACASDDGKSTAVKVNNDGVPTVSSAGLKSMFNRVEYPTVSFNEEWSKKQLIGKNAQYQRVLWQESFLDPTSTGLRQPFAVPSWNVEYSISIQPFVTMGHLALSASFIKRLASKAQKPEEGFKPSVLVLAKNPGTNSEEYDKEALLDPDEYRQVTSQKSTLAASELARCNAALTSTDKIPSQLTIHTCTQMFQGFAITSGGQTGTYNNAFDDLLAKQSVTLWSAVCPSGYQSLGHVATNGEGKKPATEQDFSSSVFDTTFLNPAIYARSAVYCIKEKYLVPGRIGEKITSLGDYGLYQVVNDPAEPKGYADGNLFVAIKGTSITEAIRKANKVWVVNKDHVIFVDEDTLVAKPVTLPTK